MLAVPLWRPGPPSYPSSVGVRDIQGGYAWGRSPSLKSSYSISLSVPHLQKQSCFCPLFTLFAHLPPHLNSLQLRRTDSELFIWETTQATVAWFTLSEMIRLFCGQGKWKSTPRIYSSATVFYQLLTHRRFSFSIYLIATSS